MALSAEEIDMSRSFPRFGIFVLWISILLLLPASGVSARTVASAGVGEQRLSAALPASSGEVAVLNAPQLINQPTHRDIFPWTAVDSKNITHIVFTANDRGLWYDNDADGFGRHPQLLEAALGANREPFETIAVGPDDTIHLVYTLLDGDQQVYYRQAHLVGHTAVWSPRELISSGFKALSATLTVDSQNNAHLVWIEKRCG